MKNLLEKYKDKLPESYLDFMSGNKRFYGDLGEQFGYVDIWEISFLTSVFDTICSAFDSMGRDCFPIGSDGGDEIICVNLLSPAKELFYIPDISISDEDATLYCSDSSKLFNAIKQHPLE